MLLFVGGLYLKFDYIKIEYKRFCFNKQQSCNSKSPIEEVFSDVLLDPIGFWEAFSSVEIDSVVFSIVDMGLFSVTIPPNDDDAVTENKIDNQ